MPDYLYLLVAIVLLLAIYLAVRAVNAVSRAGCGASGDVDTQGLLEELASLRSRVEQIEKRLDGDSDPVATDEQDSLYQTAQRLIGDGYSVDEVAGRLGLSRAEVDLISVLQREASKP